MRSEIFSLFKLAAPIILSVMGMRLMAIVDQIFVGKLSAVELAGVGAGGDLFWPIVVSGLGILGALDTYISQAMGARNQKLALSFLFQGLWSVLILSLPSLGVVWLVLANYYRVGPAPEVLPVVQTYVGALSHSLPAAMLWFCLQRYWQAKGVVWPFLFMVFFANGVNFLADWVFVLGNWGFPSYGAEGAAYATVASRYFLCTLAALFTVYHHWRDPLLSQIKMGIDLQRQKDIFKLGIPSSAQLLLEVGAFATVTTLASRLGAIPLAAHSITLNIAAFCFMIPLGISFAGNVRVGKLIGARHTRRARQAGWLVLALCTGTMVFTSFLLFTFPQPLLGMFTSDSRVLVAASQILFWAAAFQIFDGMQVGATGILKGCGDTQSPMIANFVGHYPIGMALGVYLAFYRDLGLTGLWVGLAVGLMSVALSTTLLWGAKKDLRRLV